MHVAQLTPRGSGCSIVFGDLPSQREMAPGSIRGLQLVVADAAAARQELIGRGVECSEIMVFDERDGGTFFGFSDPDGNTLGRPAAQGPRREAADPAGVSRPVRGGCRAVETGPPAAAERAGAITPSVDGREVVLVEPLGGLLADPGALDVGRAEVEAGQDPALDRVVDHVGEPVVGPGRARRRRPGYRRSAVAGPPGLVSGKAILSVPKNSRALCHRPGRVAVVARRVVRVARRREERQPVVVRRGRRVAVVGRLADRRLRPPDPGSWPCRSSSRSARRPRPCWSWRRAAPARSSTDPRPSRCRGDPCSCRRPDWR